MKKVVAWVLAFLLAIALALFCLTFVFRQAVLPGTVGKGAKANSQVVSAEQELIRERVTELAGLYGFTPGPVIDAVSGEALDELNAKAALWWNTVLTEGKAGTRPKLDIGMLREVLLSDPLVAKNEDSEALAETAADAVNESVVRVVLPVRQEIVSYGMRKAGQKIDLIDMMDFLIRVPWAALALALLLAGLIALMESRRLSGCLKYIGSAMGAAALTVVAVAVLAALAGVRPMIQVASRSLAIQYDGIRTGMVLRTAGLAAVLAAGCVLCLTFHRRSAEPNES